ncbi:tRNA-dihydrouridine(47) synthase [NAD(P)(+)]-like [Ditylenchus destructor]|nr:tRNA-dihydrouridine(47) synthase [NAD(P)(+)]-like [Ditylenchus destructor]
MDDVRLKVSIDESGQSLQNAQSTEVKHGYARIKAEYVISKPLGVKNLSQSAAIAELCLTENKEKSDKATQNKKTYGQPKRTRGMDKTREKKMANARKEVNQNVVRLCKSASMPGAKCKFGDKCTALHSKAEYWSRRPEDIGMKFFCSTKVTTLFNFGYEVR